MGVSQSEERDSNGFQYKLNGFHGSSDASLFSRSLPVTFHDKCKVYLILESVPLGNFISIPI